MKTLKFNYLIILLSLLVFSCVRGYDGPPLEEPNYDGEANITIEELKERYNEVTDPTLIEYNFVVKATIIGNDESGNIYKQLYIEDATGGITIGIEQNSIFATHRVGQEVYLNLHNLYILKYGGEHQIGYGDTNANRIPWQIFIEHINFQGYPNASKATPTTLRIDQLSDDNVSTLVRFDNIYFVNGGKAAFTKDDNTTEEAIKDGNGNTINVRTSSYSNFANELLPEGGGSIVGVLGRYNGSWQLMIRDTNDLIDFGQDLPGTTDPGGNGDVLFLETFGTGYYPSGSRPKIADFTDFDMKAPISYSDPTGNADVRSMSGDNGAHVWLPANSDAGLTITGINTTGYENLILSFELAANLYSSGEAMNLNAMTVTVNGTALTMPDTPVSNANGDNSKFYTFTFENAIPVSNNVTIEFLAPGGNNPYGIRLDNIKLYTAGSGIEL